MEQWPAALEPSSVEFYPVRPVSSSRSVFAPGVQTQERLGAGYWQARLTFPRLNAEKAGILDALLLRLGGAGRVRLPNFRKTKPLRGFATGLTAEEARVEVPWQGGKFWRGGRGWRRGTLLQVRAAAVGAQSVTTLGWTPGVVVLSPGDCFEFTGGRLHQYSGAAPLVSDIDGSATVTFWPPLREAVGDGDPLILDRPSAKMMISGGAVPNPTVKPMTSTFTLEFSEDTR